MERVIVAISAVEGIERREFNSGSKAGAVEKIIRERYGLRNGSLSQDQLTFTEEETLLPGNYVFDGFTREGKCYHVLFLSMIFMSMYKLISHVCHLLIRNIESMKMLNQRLAFLRRRNFT